LNKRDPKTDQKDLGGKKETVMAFTVVERLDLVKNDHKVVWQQLDSVFTQVRRGLWIRKERKKI